MRIVSGRPGYEIVFEDDCVLVCRKAAGLATESALTGAPDLAGRLRLYLKGEEEGGGAPYLGIVHRLDQPVEGLLVFAKTPEAAAELSAQVRDGRMEKTYLAMVHLPEGAPKTARLEDQLVREGSGVRMARPGEKGAKRAALSYEVLEKGGEFGLLKVSLETGRRHQIRAQLAAAGMPILGDRRYGRGDEGDRFPALCAARLGFDHPRTRERLVFEKIPSGGRWDESAHLASAREAHALPF